MYIYIYTHVPFSKLSFTNPSYAAHRCPRSSSKQSVAFTPTPEGMPSVQSTRTVTVVVSEVVLDVVVAVKVSARRLDGLMRCPYSDLVSSSNT